MEKRKSGEMGNGKWKYGKTKKKENESMNECQREKGENGIMVEWKHDTTQYGRAERWQNGRIA